jgi:tetratricopeptide (TPR) repeat protein
MFSPRPCLAFVVAVTGAVWLVPSAEASNATPPPVIWKAEHPSDPRHAVPAAPAARATQIAHAKSAVHTLAKRGEFAAALQLIDEIDLLEPAAAPHADLRLVIHQAAVKAIGSSPAAIAHLKACLRQLPDDDRAQQAQLAESLFVLGRRFADWEAALQGASLLLLLDPARQDDRTFMDGAREALRRAPPRRESRPAGGALAVNQR